MAAEKASAAENADLILKKGERIPRKPHIGYSEADSLIEAWFRDGFFGTAMNDKNQYGPKDHDDSANHCLFNNGNGS